MTADTCIEVVIPAVETYSWTKGKRNVYLVFEKDGTYYTSYEAKEGRTFDFINKQ